jgi:ribonucleotide monophosphatase NagD (HAD superfamily)
VLHLLVYVFHSVLVVGNQMYMDVAASYGLKGAMHINELARQHTDMTVYDVEVYNHAPYCLSVFGEDCEPNENRTKCTNLQTKKATDFPDFAAMLVFGPPNFMYQWMQIGVDMLVGTNPGKGDGLSENQIPIYFSATDLLFPADFAQPRYGLGMFAEAIKGALNARLAEQYGLSDSHIQERENFLYYGKPYVAQYTFTERVLQGLAGDKNSSSIDSFFMIGDSPYTDMMGAFNAQQQAGKDGSPWSWCGVCVETGIYHAGDELPTGSCTTVPTIQEGVEWILANPGGATMVDNRSSEIAVDTTHVIFFLTSFLVIFSGLSLYLWFRNRALKRIIARTYQAHIDHQSTMGIEGIERGQGSLLLN